MYIFHRTSAVTRNVTRFSVCVAKSLRSALPPGVGTQLGDDGPINQPFFGRDREAFHQFSIFLTGHLRNLMCVRLFKQGDQQIVLRTDDINKSSIAGSAPTSRVLPIPLVSCGSVQMRNDVYMAKDVLLAAHLWKDISPILAKVG